MNESLSFLSSKCLNVNNINWGSPYNTLNKERSELFRDLESNKELVLQESMATFERDELLGKNIEVAMVIKRSNQLERDEYTKNIELNLANGSIKTGLRGSDKSTRYHDGFFIKTNLDDNFLDIDCNSIYTTLK